MRNILQIHLTSPSEISQLPKELFEMFIFRGEPSTETNIHSRLDRLIHPNSYNIQNRLRQEKEMLLSFKKDFPSSEKPPQQEIDWLLLMHHYGSATRMLEFTENLYIAMFFGLYNTKSDAKIFAFNKNLIYSNALDKTTPQEASNFSISVNKLNEINRDTCNNILASQQVSTMTNILSISAKHLSPTKAYQQSIFIFPSQIKMPLKEYVTGSEPNIKNEFNLNSELVQNISNFHLVELTIKHDNMQKFFNSLNQMNINPATIFQGIEGLALNQNKIKYPIQ